MAVNVSGLFLARYNCPIGPWTEWLVSCAKTGLDLAGLNIYPDSTSNESWSVSDNEHWPILSKALAEIARIDVKTYQSIFDEACDLRKHGFVYTDFLSGSVRSSGSFDCKFFRSLDDCGNWLLEMEQTPEEFIRFWMDLKRLAEAENATRLAKKGITYSRRNEFANIRASKVLEMIESGHLYVCAVNGCGCSKELTVDHIIPVSRGGSDDISNLQFMCRMHNSSKGSKILQGLTN